ncbi:GNAT family N-acetyltransferase [Curvivirga aplysinae]|uniref:GNAT family N-acetyltransferase n=1 Tax=Curvivirga aplysinae TaxID=2529852 RepID=UPI0012BCBCA7|nr:GNAT family N-acetyltransferase [Curvivirga aplysinae]MTI10400.1 GNAT family N-acetyltransferase [Curvivirga aplysinae]
MGAKIVLASEDIEKFKVMTFPEYRRLLDGFCGNSSLILVASENQTHPEGLVVCQIDPSKNVGEILSVFVRKECRQTGIAQEMFKILEARLNELGIQSVELKYTVNNQKLHPIEEFLAKLGWPQPNLRMMLFDIAIDKLVSANWVQDIKEIQDEYRISYWHTVSEIELATLQTESWIPQELSPSKHQFQGLDGKAVVPELSFVLRQNEEIIGWHFTHKIDEEIARFSVSYIHPKFQQNLLLLKLWYYAGIEAQKAGYKSVRLGASIRHKQMMQFCERYLGPLATKVDYSKGAFKLLQTQEEAAWV